MRRLIAWNAIVALLLATLYAPLFHVHADGGEAPLVHAHLPELEVALDESVVHMESFHSHAMARSVDLLTTITASNILLHAVLVSLPVSSTSIPLCSGFVSIATTRAHGPPAIRSRIPRSPPA